MWSMGCWCEPVPIAGRRQHAGHSEACKSCALWEEQHGGSPYLRTSIQGGPNLMRHVEFFEPLHHCVHSLRANIAYHLGPGVFQVLHKAATVCS